jgi:hypothetical protein
VKLIPCNKIAPYYRFGNRFRLEACPYVSYVNAIGDSLSRCSSVSIVTRQWAGKAGFDSWQGLGFFLFATLFRPALGPTQPPFQRILEVISSGVKRPGDKINHAPPPSAEVKNVWSYEGVSKSSRTESITKYKSTFGITR